MTEQQTFINQIAPLVQLWAPNYSIAVVSPIIAQACLESAYGTSSKARMGHNYFGLKWRDKRCPISNEWFEDGGAEQLANGGYQAIYTKWCKFKSMEDGVIGYFQWTNTSNYKSLKNVTDPRTYLENIKAAGYATSQKYVENVMNVIDKWNLTQYDTLWKPTVPKEENKVSYAMKTNYAARGNYGAQRSLSDIQFIVIHYTANDGDTDEANGNYFRNNIVKASAHYFVDDDSVTQSVPDDFVAWSVGGDRYSNYQATGGAKYYGVCKNANSISIEICDTVRDGRVYPTEKTIANVVLLTRQLMSKYGITLGHVIRHFDVTGKACPAYWTDDNKWKNEFVHKLLNGGGTSAPEPIAPKKLYKVQCGAFKIKLNAINLQNRLASQGFNTFLTQVDGLWKVQCGAYSIKANAEAQKTKLLQKGFAAIIIE